MSFYLHCKGTNVKVKPDKNQRAECPYCHRYMLVKKDSTLHAHKAVYGKGSKLMGRSAAKAGVQIPPELKKRMMEARRPMSKDKRVQDLEARRKAPHMCPHMCPYCKQAHIPQPPSMLSTPKQVREDLIAFAQRYGQQAGEDIITSFVMRLLNRPQAPQ